MRISNQAVDLKLKSFILLFSIIILSCNENVNQKTNSTKSVLNNENLPTQNFEINTSFDTIIMGENGTKITIEKNSFVDKNGQLINGKISFELKEALTPLAMLLGNLTTISDGRILQTGGMIYTNATAKGENVFIAKNKTLQISVPTENKNDSMLIFKGEMNPETQTINWVNPEDIIEKSKISDEPIFDEHKNREVPLVKIPEKPIEINKKSDRILSIKFENTSMFPELKPYRNVKFRVSEKSEYNIEDAKKTWHDVKLEKTNEEGFYKITFEGVDKGKMNVKSYIVSPAFEGNDYKKALAKYERKFKEYEEKKKQIEEKLDLLKYTNKHESDQQLTYIYKIKNFGWSNIDRFAYLPNNNLEFVVNIENKNNDDQIYILLSVKNEKFFIPGYQKKDGTYGFSHNDAEPTKLPVGEEAIILATTYRNNVPYFAFQKIIITQKQNINLSLTETTKEKLETYLKENI